MHFIRVWTRVLACFWRRRVGGGVVVASTAGRKWNCSHSQSTISYLDLTTGCAWTSSLLSVQVLREESSDELTAQTHTNTLRIATHADTQTMHKCNIEVRVIHTNARTHASTHTTYNSLLCISSMMSLNNTSLFLSQKPSTS